MKKNLLFRKLFFIAVFLLFMSFLPKGDSFPAWAEESSCDSFGIQRYSKNKEAPDFTLNTLDGQEVTLSRFRGKPVLIIFFASWCKACKEDIPLLEKMAARHKGQLVVLLIAIDGEKKEALHKIVEENKITLPVLLIIKEKIMRQYEVRGWIPLSVLIDQKGMLTGKIIGQRDWSSEEAWSCMKELLTLREPASTH